MTQRTLAEQAARMGYALGPHRFRQPKPVPPEHPGFVENPLSGTLVRVPTAAEIATTGGAARVVARIVVKPVVRVAPRPAAASYAITTQQIAALLHAPSALDRDAVIRRQAGEIVAARIRAAVEQVRAEDRKRLRLPG